MRDCRLTKISYIVQATGGIEATNKTESTKSMGNLIFIKCGNSG